QFHFPEAGASPRACHGGKRRARPLSGQAAIRGGTGGDRQGRFAARSGEGGRNRPRDRRMAPNERRLACSRPGAVAHRGRRWQPGVPAGGPQAMTERLTISELGAQGDGISHTPQGLVYVPFALPGEVVVAQVEKQRGRLVSIETPSPLRVEPVSPPFGTCGGCAVQHLATSAYAEWKREKVVRALRSRRLMAEVGPLVLCPPASRRRVTLT